MPIRVKRIYDRLCEIINQYHPDEFAIETAFYGKNVQSALKIGHARGVSILAAVNYEIPTAEYSPREVKKAVTGNGAASKQQVQFMVKTHLKLRESRAAKQRPDTRGGRNRIHIEAGRISFTRIQNES
jgi:crossover junction endodeoxyribonuclease RuvC